MTALARTGRYCAVAPILAAAGWLSIQPASAFYIRNDTGAPIRVKSEGSTAAFTVEIANNTKICCSPKDKNWSSGPGEFHPQALTDPDVSLSAHPAPTVQPPRDVASANEP